MASARTSSTAPRKSLRAREGRRRRTRARRVAVLVPLALDAPYDYRLPEGLDAPAGAFVRVPLGPRVVIGVVWGEGAGDVAETRLKSVAEVLDAPPLAAPFRRFIDWVAAYTMAPRGAVLRMAMSVAEALRPPKPRRGLRLAEGGPPPGLKITPARARALAAAGEGPARGLSELARAAGVSPSVVRGLAEAGALETAPMPPAPAFAAPDPARPGPRLTPVQAAAAEALVARAREGGFSVTLLDGVNGSGKTEVYFAAIAAVLKAGRQALVLLPEIALSAQWLARFAERFGAAPAVWHSELTPAQRRAAWRAVANGEARVVVGARSALFLPFADLGLIVVDEEHDASFKQEDGVVYHARDMAVVRARIEGLPLVLSSATPSLETVVNVARGRYGRLALPDPHGSAARRTIEAIDMRKSGLPATRWLSPRLVEAMAETFAAGEQAMLFLNRRGYAPLTLCRACGHRFGCPNCAAWLVEHRHLGRLVCHHCGYAMALPEACPECGAEGRLAACGPGVERLAEEVAAAFPGLRAAIMASDTLFGPRAAAEMVRRVSAHEIDLLIGTQIMAKGHHFPLLTLVGVVDADLGLSGGDLRASERTYQLLHQVAGRAGRAERAGRVLLQTYMPEHPVMAALIAGDRDAFLEREAEDRRARGLPPFGRLAAVIVSGASEEAVRETARGLARTAPRGGGVETLGPAPAPLALLRGRYRYRLLVKAPRAAPIQKILRAWLGGTRPRGGVRVRVDIDPYSFL